MSATKLIIFDLDGTILNTISDLAYCTNHALEKAGFPTHEVEAYNFFVGNGINKLFERSLPENQRNEENINILREFFLPYYELHNSDYTKPYEGITELLETLSAKGIKLAIASNKYQKATEELAKIYFPQINFVAVLGQREGVPTKPSPRIVFEILQKTGVSTKETLYVGDSGVDMQTAFNSGIVSIGVTWGFRPRSELERAGAKQIVDSPSEILNFIEN